jgi:hypothetical protein
MRRPRRLATRCDDDRRDRDRRPLSCSATEQNSARASLNLDGATQFDRRRRGMSVYHKLRRFVQAHQPCGVLRSDMESSTGTGFLLWIDCPCGASFGWVAVQHEDEALLRSALLGGDRPCLSPPGARVRRANCAGRPESRLHQVDRGAIRYGHPFRLSRQGPLRIRRTIPRRTLMWNGLPTTGTCVVLMKSSYGPASA